MSAVFSTAHLVDYVYVQGDTVKVNFCFQDKSGNPIPSTAVAGTTSGLGWVLIEGTITTTTSGTWSILWAQNASDVGQIIARAGSYIEVKRIK